MIIQPKSVANPDFPESGANSPSGCADLLFYNFFAENCMKMKEFEPRVTCPWHPLGSANFVNNC